MSSKQLHVRGTENAADHLTKPKSKVETVELLNKMLNWIVV